MVGDEGEDTADDVPVEPLRLGAYGTSVNTQHDMKRRKLTGGEAEEEDETARDDGVELEPDDLQAGGGELMHGERLDPGEVVVRCSAVIKGLRTVLECHEVEDTPKAGDVANLSERGLIVLCEKDTTHAQVPNSARVRNKSR